MFFVYILRLQQNNSFYVGSCKDLKARIDLHNWGLVRSTKRYLPWYIVYTEKYPTLSAARKREKQIKSWKKRSMIENLIEHFKNK
jgi:putative endonuclease